MYFIILKNFLVFGHLANRLSKILNFGRTAKWRWGSWHVCFQLFWTFFSNQTRSRFWSWYSAPLRIQNLMFFHNYFANFYIFDISALRLVFFSFLLLFLFHSFLALQCKFSQNKTLHGSCTFHKREREPWMFYAKWVIIPHTNLVLGYIGIAIILLKSCLSLKNCFGSKSFMSIDRS